MGWRGKERQIVMESKKERQIVMERQKERQNVMERKRETECNRETNWQNVMIVMGGNVIERQTGKM